MMPRQTKCGCECVSEASFNRFSENHTEYFKKIRDHFDATLNAGTKREENFVKKLVSIGKDVESLRQKLQVSERKVTALEKRVEELELNFPARTDSLPGTRVPYKRSSHTSVQPPEDTCELLVTGLPSSMKESPAFIIKRLLLFLSLSNALSHVLTTREWRPKFYKGTARAFAVKFSSPLVRNEVLKAVYAIKHLNSKDIFATDNCLKLRVSELLPKSTHLLLMQACKISKASDFSPPFVRNGTVYIRKSKCSTPIPILTENDLSYLNCNSQATALK